VYLLAPWIVGAGALLVARRNHKSGRTDLRGASRLGLAIFVCSFLGWGVTAHHVATVEYAPSVFRALSAALTIGVFGAVLYMAIEPFIRRRWPESLISWTRLLAGRVRDPLVGSHILAGSAFGIGLTLWLTLKRAALLNQGLVTTPDWRMLNGPGWMVYSLVWNLVWWSVVKALAICVLLLFAKVLLRRDWIAIGVAVLLANVVTIVGGPRLLIEIAFEVPAAAVAVWLLIRWGILPMMVALFIAELVIYTPLTTDFAAWYSGPTLLVAVVVLGLAIWSFSVAMAGRSLLEHELVERRA
jgi:serine/threonine-protein kinase